MSKAPRTRQNSNGPYLSPQSRNSCVVHIVQCIAEVLLNDRNSINYYQYWFATQWTSACGRMKRSQPYLAHNDGSFYSKLQVSQCLSHQADHALHAVNLLSEKDVHGRQSSHLLKSRSHLSPHKNGQNDHLTVNVCVLTAFCSAACLSLRRSAEPGLARESERKASIFSFTWTPITCSRSLNVPRVLFSFAHSAIFWENRFVNRLQRGGQKGDHS